MHVARNSLKLQCRMRLLAVDERAGTSAPVSRNISEISGRQGGMLA